MLNARKGGLIFPSLKCAKSLLSAFPPEEKILRMLFGTFLVEWSQNEKLSEIKLQQQDFFLFFRRLYFSVDPA